MSKGVEEADEGETDGMEEWADSVIEKGELVGEISSQVAGCWDRKRVHKNRFHGILSLVLLANDV
jgi:hypothetical protein